jgi:hypothetical protein
MVVTKTMKVNPRKVKKGRAEVVFDPPNTPNDVGKVMNDVGKAKIYPWGLIHYPPEVVHGPPDSVNDRSEAEKCWRHAFIKLAPCLLKLVPCLLKLAPCLLKLTPCLPSDHSRLFLYVETPLTRPSATLSPLTRGEGQLMRASRFVALLPACGEKVPEGRMRGAKPIDSTLTGH